MSDFMDEGQASKTEEFLLEWERRHRINNDAAPAVRRQLERAKWMREAADAINATAPGEVTRQLNSSLMRDHLRIVQEFPLPRVSGLTLTYTTSTSTAVSEMYAVSVLGDLSEKSTGKYRQLLTNYDGLNTKQNRFGQTVARMDRCFPNVTAFLKDAELQYRRASSPSEISAAANAMRVLIDKLKGEFLDKARTHPNENKITWEEAANRLVIARLTDEQRTLLAEQWPPRSALFDLLSNLSKRRAAPTPDALHSAWGQTLDHCFIVCGCLLPAPDVFSL
jgi:hypothetical protein